MLFSFFVVLSGGYIERIVKDFYALLHITEVNAGCNESHTLASLYRTAKLAWWLEWLAGYCVDTAAIALAGWLLRSYSGYCNGWLAG